MFGPDVKKQVFIKWRELFGETSVIMTGRRDPKTGLYTVELWCGGVRVAGRSHREWRRAYKLVKGEVEKLYVEGYVPPTV